MKTEPYVLTEYNKFILSTSIEHGFTGHDTIQPQTEKHLQQLDLVFQPILDWVKKTR